MIHLFPRTGGVGSQMTRRQIVKMSALAAGSFAHVASSWELLARENSTRRPTAKCCIYIFLCGGPSQPDLWDMKPDAPSGMRSQFEPIETNVPGIYFGELIPQVARHADKLV